MSELSRISRIYVITIPAFIMMIRIWFQHSKPRISSRDCKPLIRIDDIVSRRLYGDRVHTRFLHVSSWYPLVLGGVRSFV